MMTILLIIILLALIVIAAFDFVPFVTDVIGRRGMGSFSSGAGWFANADFTAQKWLKKGVPVVPKKAAGKYSFFEYIKGERRSEAIQFWQEGSVLLAVNESAPEKALDFIKEKLSQKEAFNTGRVDIAMLAYGILKNSLADKDEIKPYMDNVVQLLLNKFDKNGKIPYGGNEDICFVDTIGLVCPFLAEYSAAYGNEKALIAAVKLIQDYSEKGIHKELGLPVHCYNDKNNAPLGIYGWGRGCGWWAVGLADTFSALAKKDGYLEEKTFILKEIIRFADTIINYQCRNGAFDRNVLHFSGEDSSATAMISYFLVSAGRLSKRKEYISAAEKGMKYVYSVTRKSGAVDYSQGDTTGAGFYSQESIIVPAAQGFAIRAYLMLKEEDDG